MFLGPRNYFVQSTHLQNGPSNSRSTLGYYVVTPFALKGQSERILVKRGWVPREKRDEIDHSDGVVKIEAIRRKSETREEFGIRCKLTKCQNALDLHQNSLK
ncbi:hypothetical protein HK098_002794 [Nowakowskiella sp. JEL0407]|nr:hypothetical protein HK098_002794 [Nowakowskiella sp. JEL0407]